MKRLLLVVFIFATLPSRVAADEYIWLDFGSWKTLYNCDKRGFELFQYTTVPDTGDLPRYGPFHHEKKLPGRCRQKSTGSYRHKNPNLPNYHRGHGVHQNIWDHSKALMQASNSMANIVPQAAALNTRGVWRETEKLTECWRDHGAVYVWGGVIWGNDKSNDVFVESHGVITPDWLWKLIIFPNGAINAWLMPNDESPTADKMDDYLVAPAVLSSLVGVAFPVGEGGADTPAKTSMKLPSGCSLR